MLECMPGWTKPLVIILGISWFGCASPKPITGGPADETPPAIIENESTPNEQTNFTLDEIVITFDEWVSLKDVYSQIVISPPMPVNPEIKQKGKSVIIELPETLRENTTYTINFGNAIADLNEGNILENYVYVFSTGPVLDSLQLRGTVIDAVTLKAADDVWVMLYQTGEDSAVYKRKPDYLSRTNKEGVWQISFLPADSFDVVALKDDNVNFLYDQEGEYFGWLPAVVYSASTESELPPIFVFPLEARTVITEVVHVVPGWMKIVIASPYPKPIPVLDPPIANAVSAWDADTLHVWYDPQTNYTGYAILNEDSTQVRASAQPSMLERPVLIRAVTKRLHQGGKAVFSLNVPVASLDTSRIIVMHDSLGNIPLVVERDSTDVRKFTVEGPWISQTIYPILILPGAVTDYWGRTNDTIRQSVAIDSDEQFGDLYMTIEGLDSSMHYVVFLKEGTRTIDTFVIQDRNTVLIIKRGLSPQNYIIEIVEDVNDNGLWDTGNYRLSRQPERKMIFTPEKLRAGWEQEVKMTWRQLTLKG